VQLIKQDGTTVSGADALASKKRVLVYFSAHWCPPCRMFTPVLKDAYEDELKDKNVEVVFISSDQNAAGAKSYFNESHGDYLMTPHGCPENDELSQICKVSGIPCLAMFGENGELMTTEARNYVANGQFNKIIS